MRKVIIAFLIVTLSVILLIGLFYYLNSKHQGDRSVEEIVRQSFIDDREPLNHVALKMIKNNYTSKYTREEYEKGDLDLKTLFTNGYMVIDNYKNQYVFFFRYTNFGFTQGLAYSTDDSVPRIPYNFSQMLRLDAHWFLFKTNQ